MLCSEWNMATARRGHCRDLVTKRLWLRLTHFPPLSHLLTYTEESRPPCCELPLERQGPEGGLWPTAHGDLKPAISHVSGLGRAPSTVGSPQMRQQPQLTSWLHLVTSCERPRGGRPDSAMPRFLTQSNKP